MSSEAPRRPVRILGASATHPGRGEPSFIRLTVELQYIKGGPVSDVRMTRDAALELAEQLVRAARVVGCGPSDAA